MARYDLTPGTDSAEVAFVVSDAFQGQGLGTLFLECLAAAARQRGVSTFSAQTLASNAPMQDVFRRTGFIATTHMSYGVSDVAFSISPTQRYLDAVTTREWETRRPLGTASVGGLGLICSSATTQARVHAALGRLGVGVSVSVVTGDEPVGDVCEALAAMMCSQACGAVALVDPGLVARRPRTLVARLRSVAQLTPIVGLGLAPAHAAQAGIEVVEDLEQLSTRLRDLVAKVAEGSWKPADAGALRPRSGVDVQHAHHLLVRCANHGLLPRQLTQDLLESYGVVAHGRAAQLFASDRGVEVRSGGGLPLAGPRLLPLTDVDVRRLAAALVGREAGDQAAIELVSRLSWLVDDHPQIQQVLIPASPQNDAVSVSVGKPVADLDNPFMRLLS